MLRPELRERQERAVHGHRRLHITRAAPRQVRRDAEPAVYHELTMAAPAGERPRREDPAPGHEQLEKEEIQATNDDESTDSRLPNELFKDSPRAQDLDDYRSASSCTSPPNG